MGAVTTNFTLTTSYGYTYATFKDYITTNSKLEEISYNGNYVPFVPKHTLSLGGQYIFRINPGHWLDRIQLNANYTGAGRIYWTEQNDVSQAFYGTLNGRLSLQKGNGQIDFWVRNALDKDYAAFYFESMGNGFMQKGRPIQAGIEAGKRGKVSIISMKGLRELATPYYSLIAPQLGQGPFSFNFCPQRPQR